MVRHFRLRLRLRSRFQSLIVRRWDCELCHIIPFEQLPKEFGFTRPTNLPALLPQVSPFVLGHAPCNRNMGKKHLYTCKRSSAPPIEVLPEQV